MGVSARGGVGTGPVIGPAQLFGSYAAKGTTMPSSSGLYPSFARALTELARKTPAVRVRLRQQLKSLAAQRSCAARLPLYTHCRERCGTLMSRG